MACEQVYVDSAADGVQRLRRSGEYARATVVNAAINRWCNNKTIEASGWIEKADDAATRQGYSLPVGGFLFARIQGQRKASMPHQRSVLSAPVDLEWANSSPLFEGKQTLTINLTLSRQEWAFLAVVAQEAGLTINETIKRATALVGCREDVL